MVRLWLLVAAASLCSSAPSLPMAPELKSLESSPRLPRHLWPIRYEVKLKPMFVEPYTIDGHVDIEMTCLESANNITIHIFDIKVVKLLVWKLNGDPVGVESFEEDAGRNFLVIHTSTPVEKGVQYLLHIDFNGVLNSGLNGFYRSTYVDENGNEQLIGSTQFSATGARRAFPCFDEPEFKATFKTTLCRMNNMTSISNMDIEKSEPEEGSDLWICDYYRESVKMSTYVLAFVISDYEHKLYEDNQRWKFSIHGKPQAMENGDADYAGSIGPKILAHYEQLYEIDYALPKLDMGAIFDFAAGAMENWGLILYRETAIFYDPDVSGAHSKRRVAEVVGHELAHMWFGNLVTNKWWTDLWLNEGFATFIEYIGVDHVEPTWRVLEEIVIKDVQEVMQFDSLESSNPIKFDPDSGYQSTTAITYSKGASVIRMMDYFLTEDTFHRGLISYLNAFAYGCVEQDDLFYHLTKQAHEEGILQRNMTVKQVMDTWTLQPGYPVLMVKRSADGKGVTLTQKRFLLYEDHELKQDSAFSWWIPLTFTTSTHKDFSKENAKASNWMQPEAEQMQMEGVCKDDKDWVVFNILENGYYRVNYDQNNWRLLTQQLHEDHLVFPSVQRCQLLDDAFNLARAGQLDYGVALGAAGYLSQEEDYYPMSAFFTCFDYIDLMFVRSPSYGKLKGYIDTLMKPHYETIDFKVFEHVDTNYPSITDIYWNITLVEKACYYGDTDCIDHVQSLFKQFQKNYNKQDPDDPKNQIIPDLKSIVYCTALKHGSDDQWEFLWNHYHLTQVAAEKDTILAALGCSSQTWIMNRYLGELLQDDGSIRSQDSNIVFKSVADNPLGTPLAWNFLRANHEELSKKYGIGGFASAATEGFNTQFELQEVKDFNEKTGGGLEDSIVTVERNVKWMDDYYQYITQQFTK